ncbi:hypothetical protein DRJ27_00460 [Candidatus Acetothermia bacterium]|nr:MAG: hypothetical protein DRJ27_00460 [Candidatus Acetothermia bacterium]
MWVHAVQEYIDSPRILLEFPGIHVTYDLQPSLLKQLLDYAEITPAEREKSGLYRYIGELDNHLKMDPEKNLPQAPLSVPPPVPSVTFRKLQSSRPLGEKLPLHRFPGAESARRRWGSSHPSLASLPP